MSNQSRKIGCMNYAHFPKSGHIFARRGGGMPPGKFLKLATCGEIESEGILKNFHTSIRIIPYINKLYTYIL